jgi:hypothetical protein
MLIVLPPISRRGGDAGGAGGAAGEHHADCVTLFQVQK